MMVFKRGTPVTFVGPIGDKGQQQLSKKYGIIIGDKGKVVRSNGGWTRVTWIRGDGSSAVSVPTRPNWIMCCAEAVQPPMNENFGLDEQPTPDAVVADMKKEAEKVRNRSVCARLGIEISAAREKMFERRRELVKKVNQGVLSFDEMFLEEERAVAAEERADAAKEAKLKAELVQAHEAAAAAAASAAVANAGAAEAAGAASDALTELEEVKLQLISARTLMQLKDKTIAQLRGEPANEGWSGSTPLSGTTGLLAAFERRASARPLMRGDSWDLIEPEVGGE